MYCLVELLFWDWVEKDEYYWSYTELIMVILVPKILQ